MLFASFFFFFSLFYLLRAVRVSLTACEQMRSMIPDGMITPPPFYDEYIYIYVFHKRTTRELAIVEREGKKRSLKRPNDEKRLKGANP